MAIPFVQTPTLQPTQLNQATPSAQALAAPAAGLGDVARGIAQVGNAFAQQAERVQRLENARLESEARQAITGELAAFQEKTRSINDPGMLLPELEKTIERTSAIADDPNLPDFVRERVSLWHNDAANSAKLQTAANAGKLSMRRAELALQNEFNAAVTANDSAIAEDVLSRGVEAGLLNPEEKQAKLAKFAETQVYNALAKEIDTDPQAFLDMAATPEFTEKTANLSETNRNQLMKYATVQANNQKAQTWEQIQISSLEGKILAKDEVLALAKEGDITAAQAGRYLRSYHGGTPPAYDADVYDAARNMILQYDPTKDETGEMRATIAAELATTPLPKQYIEELQRQFTDRQAKPKASKHRLATEYADRINTEWTSEAFGDWYDMPETPNAQKIIRWQDWDSSLSYKTKVQDTFMRWLDKQPDDLDPIDAGKKYSEIKSQILADQPPVDLTAPSMAPAPTFDDPVAPVDPDPNYAEPEGTAIDGAPGVLPMPEEAKKTSFRFRQPLKLSNYGYASDTTPDSYSARGIGHKNNKLVDGISAAVTKSLADSLGLKSGDWFIAKTTQGDFRVRYDDTVPDSDPRTGPLPPTIDIYRKSKGSNSWGGKVLGIQLIDPPSKKVSDVRTEKIKAFKEMRPTHPDAAQFLIDQTHALCDLSYLS